MKTPPGFVVLISLFLFSSCAVVVKTDTLPKNSPKGYVEFYKVWIPPIPVRLPPGGYSLDVYELIDGKESFLVEIGKTSGKIHERVALVPGEHTFIVRVYPGEIDKTVTIPVQEDINIPVRIDLKIQYIGGKVEKKFPDGKYSPLESTTYWDIQSDLHVEEAIPVKKK
jgi:hypothetical protein